MYESLWFMKQVDSFDRLQTSTWFTSYKLLYLYISSFLLVKETGVPGENHRHVARHWQAIT